MNHEDDTFQITEGLKRLSVVLHDLCQPTTTLQCKLEIAELIGTDEAYRDAVRVSLNECERLTETVVRMRTELRHMLAEVSASPAARGGCAIAAEGGAGR